jgi:hypothetical protein
MTYYASTRQERMKNLKCDLFMLFHGEKARELQQEIRK